MGLQVEGHDIANETQLYAKLKQLSVAHGGAWVAVVTPFTHKVTFHQFASPCKVPDHYHDLASNTMAYRGKLQGFTKAAIIREQNRGLGRS